MTIQDIKRFRELVGIKACDVAKAIGMDRGNYSAWEAGRKEYRRKGHEYVSKAYSYLDGRCAEIRGVRL